MSALTVTPPPLADIVAVLAEVTTDVVIVYVAVLSPAGIVTLAGTWATAVRLLERVTTRPPVGAGPSSVIVPVEEAPPWTVLGLIVCTDMTGAVTDSRAPTEVPR